MQKLMYFLFGFITALFAAVIAILNQGLYFLDEEAYQLLCEKYNCWYYSEVVIITLFIFCVLSFVYTLGSGYKEEKDGYKEIKPK